ncbi:monovalent cation:proton antiporter-2 (CPA2) family protein [Derxia gummosa]|uniref:Monovalent cation:proton antiporter-2 (CPA2) family protein n=1 Tax=Derxia gummosa DSM 723 TaxID=1121388 RepID=A0A8B6XBH6_9BURK|nr:monovalent cation:proton antiporter-2 (CPA2) family protein [Derxia gummosa]
MSAAAPPYLVQSGVFLAAAVVAVPLFKRLGFGAVLGYLIAGVFLGPSGFALVHDPERVLDFAEFGVVLLLFLIGLELEPARAWAMRRPIFGLGGLQVLGTTALALGGAMLLGVEWREALIIGMGVAMSSTALGLASLEERGLMSTPGGNASFAVLLFQDLAVIPVLLIAALVAPGHHAKLSASAVLPALAAIVAIVAIGRTLLRPVMRAVAKTGLRELFVALALLIVIGVSLAMQKVGLSMALGTFLAGVLLADSEYRHELQLDIEPFKGLLLGLFFMAVGMTVDLRLVAANPGTVFGLALLIVAAKFALLYGLARATGQAPRDAGLFAVALSQVGEFAFVIYGLGEAQKNFSARTADTLNAVVAVTMLVTPLLFVATDRFLRRRLAPGKNEAIDERKPVIVAGFGRFGQVLVRVLTARGIETTVIDRDPDQIELMREFGWRCYYGDATRLDVLRQAGIDEARLFVLAIDEPAQSIKVAKLLRERWPALPIVARARSRTEAYAFRELGIVSIRETFHSSLEAAAESLMHLGMPRHTAQQVVREFERYDRKMLEHSFAVRHDRKALMSLAEQGRRDLEELLSNEKLLREVGTLDGVTDVSVRGRDGVARNDTPRGDAEPPRAA